MGDDGREPPDPGLGPHLLAEEDWHGIARAKLGVALILPVAQLLYGYDKDFRNFPRVHPQAGPVKMSLEWMKPWSRL